MISLQHSTIQTPDGATLAVYRTEKRRPGPSLVLAGGIAGGVDAWRLLIDDFAPFHQIISWDYRGLFRSSVGNRALRPSDVRIERHAADLALVLSELNVEQVVLIGWSMGARVALELARTAPQRVLGVVSINGAFGRPVQHALTPWIGAAGRRRPHATSCRRNSGARSATPAPPNRTLVTPRLDRRRVAVGGYGGRDDRCPTLCWSDA